jgi:mannose-6-phosphate isomerase-like protein (cupin superfamily)
MLNGQRKMLLSRRPLTQFEAYVSEFDPQGSTGPDAYSHGDSYEMFLVLTGTVTLELGSESHELAAGDCIEYPTSTPHRVVNVGGQRAEVLFIISPPTSTAAYLNDFRNEDVLPRGGQA